MKFCPNCGTRVSDEAVFCPNCGNRFRIKADKDGFSGQRSGKKQRSLSTSTIVLTAIIVALFIGCLIVGYLLFAVSRDEKANKQLVSAEQYVQKEDYQKAIDTYKDVTRTSPKNTKAYQGMGYTYSKMADQEQDEAKSVDLRREAVKSYEKVLEINSHNVEVRNEIIIQYNIILVYLENHENKTEADEIKKQIAKHQEAKEKVTAKEKKDQQKSDKTNTGASDKNSDDENVKKDDSSKKRKFSEEEVRSIYKDFYNSYFQSAGSIDGQERKEVTLTFSDSSTSAAEWYICNGIIGVDLADLDHDGQDEMIVYYIDTKEVTINDVTRRGSYPYAEIYTITESGEVERVVSAQLSEETTGINTSVEKIGIAEINDKEYLYHYEYLNSTFGNGTAGYYVLYMIDEGTFRRAYVLGQEEPGSSGLHFVVDTYTDWDKLTSVCCAWDGNDSAGDLPRSEHFITFDYTNRYDCDRVCWKQLGVDMEAPRDSISEGADYWNTDLVRNGFSYVITSSDIEYGYSEQTAHMYSEIESRTEYKPQGGIQTSETPVQEKEVKETAPNESGNTEGTEKSTANNSEKAEKTGNNSVKDTGEVSYKQVIENLEQEYGVLDVNIYEAGHGEKGSDYRIEADGLCYLEMIDFNNDGTEELLAVAKKVSDPDYTIYVYTMDGGHVKELMASNSVLNNYQDNYRSLWIKTNPNKESFIDGGFGYDSWQYFKIYGLRSNRFGLLSASSILDTYNREDVPQKKYYYIFETPPERIDANELLQDPGISEEEYKTQIEEWIYNYQYEDKVISLMYGLTESEARKGYTGTVDKEVLSKAITKIKTLFNNEQENQNSSDSENAGIQSWKQAYLDYLKSDPDVSFDTDYCTCGFIYLDGDDIPELIIDFGIEATGTRILSSIKGEIVSCQFSRTGGIRYIEREGAVYNCIMIQGTMIDEFATLDAEGFHGQGSGYRYDESQMGTNFTQFTWNGAKVTEEEYNAQIDKFDVGRATNWNAYSDELKGNNYTISEMETYLAD